MGAAGVRPWLAMLNLAPVAQRKPARFDAEVQALRCCAALLLHMRIKRARQ